MSAGCCLPGKIKYSDWSQKETIGLQLKIMPDGEQEAQLSQRDCATLRVIEYIAKLLKIIRNDTVEC